MSETSVLLLALAPLGYWGGISVAMLALAIRRDRQYRRDDAMEKRLGVALFDPPVRSIQE